MSADPDVTRIVRSWLEEGVTSLPDRVLDDVLGQLPATPQRRSLWPAWRLHTMNSPLKIALVAAVLGALAVVSIDILPRSPEIGAAPAPSPSPAPSPAPLLAGPLPAGTYVAMPFSYPGSDACFSPPQPGCSEAIPDDDIRVTFAVPDGLSGIADLHGIIGPNGADLGVGLSLEVRNTPEFAEVLFERGASPYDDPCQDPATAQIPIGPTAADFADALVAHPLLDVTTPVDVTLAGYTGKYLELQVPMDLADCEVFRPWEPGIFSKRPGERWLLWILDVDGLRVVIREMVHEGTAPEVLTQLQGVVDSIAIEPATPPAASPSPGALAWSPASLEQDWPAPVRTEPVGHFVVRWDGEYTDPAGDAGSSEAPRVDILRVNRFPCTSYGVCLELAASDQSGPAWDSEPWIAYGLVYDTDLDGVADVRLGMDRFPAEHSPWGDTSGATDVRAWRTDLRAGSTESGRAGMSVCDCLTADAGGGTAHIYPHEKIPGRFYAWASVIQDGRVVATDYAPDSGWLEVQS